MLGIHGFEHKKDLKAAVGKQPQFIETSPIVNEFRGDGTYAVVGPTPHKRVWYANITVRNGVIAKVS